MIEFLDLCFQVEFEGVLLEAQVADAVLLENSEGLLFLLEFRIHIVQNYCSQVPFQDSVRRTLQDSVRRTLQDFVRRTLQDLVWGLQIGRAHV